VRAQHTITVIPRLPESLQSLATITADLGNLFDPRVVALFRVIDPEAVDSLGLDPLGILSRLPQSRLDELAADPAFVARAQGLVIELAADATVPRWFPRRPPTALRSIAYLSPEFGIAASVPQYSGGLGVLAGDHLKAANDLGVPLTGVGLFYRRGYFQQALDRTNRQTELFPHLHPESLALAPVEDVRIEVPIGGSIIHARVWKATIGSIPLYLLDTAVDGEAESDPDQLVADRLYGGQSGDRIKQEILLGVGGFRALDALGLLPDVFHLNEGHAGFLVLEAIRRAMTDHGLSFTEAIEAVRPSVVFTTHTPVPAGIDRFGRDLIETYFTWWCEACGVTVDELMAIGAEPGGDPDVFNLAAMSLRLAGSVNGVSVLHGAVSREMFSNIWPQTPVDEVPIGSVTNGVHAQTWTSIAQARLLAHHIGTDWTTAGPESWSAVNSIPDADLWNVRRQQRERLVTFTRRRARAGALRRGARESEIRWCDTLLDPDVLTIGFARRFATYKRATLLLRDPARFRALLVDGDRPVQFVFAGKAHPADEPGKSFIQQVATFASMPDVREHMVFIEDYDIDAGRVLTQGVDVWLNTPLRPMEACGTSGMKAALNGALNCSVLDGWWDELFRPDLGWAIPTDGSAEDPEERDDRESGWLFDLLENEVVPEFYARDTEGLPRAWLTRVKNTLTGLGPQITASRMMRDYVELHYDPAAERSAQVRGDSWRLARELSEWRARVTGAWPKLSVDSVVWPTGDAILGAPTHIEVHADLDGLDTDDVEVQVLSSPIAIDGELRSPTITALPAVGRDGHVAHFSGDFVCSHAGMAGLAVRIVPHHRGLGAWTDLRLIRWAPLE
jgi:starch phosphorylase